MKLQGYRGKRATVWVLTTGSKSQSELREIIEHYGPSDPETGLTWPEQELVEADMSPLPRNQVGCFYCDMGLIVTEGKEFHCILEPPSGKYRGLLGTLLAGKYSHLSRRFG